MAAGQRAYTQQDRAEALAAMTLEGIPAERAAIELGLPPRTVQRWADRWRNVTPEQQEPALKQDDVDLALRYGGILHKAAEYIEQDDTGERAYKSMIASNAVRGTAIDKIMRRQELPHGDIFNTIAKLASEYADATVTETHQISVSVPRGAPDGISTIDVPQA